MVEPEKVENQNRLFVVLRSQDYSIAVNTLLHLTYVFNIGVYPDSLPF